MKDQLERHAKYGADIHLSPKQWAVIHQLHDKIVGGSDERSLPDVDDEIPF